MARGWESKDVEEQIAARESHSESHSHQLSAEEQALERERESLELSRTRVLQDLAAAKNPKYKLLLQRSLAFLDEKLSKLPHAS